MMYTYLGSTNFVKNNFGISLCNMIMYYLVMIYINNRFNSIVRTCKLTIENTRNLVIKILFSV